ncbi:hypothetical protein J7E23_05560 [Pseudomonas sp. ISL-88]|uniref:MFS transporter n=1 Tax=Pseudomonas sp. ISL-88 TaxID=2819169 RepID=UPI001BE54222|nr:MFS transporter [Pseudomonas sp. ISL-88]MBT2712295.1 hypothetical protein [Pseudomonas sp. ISL-88]
MKRDNLKWLILSQSSVFFASSLIFPFYILFIKNIGSSYTQFGLSYGLFGLSGALIHPLLGRLSAKVESRYFLMSNSWGMAVLLLTFPHITDVYQVYIVQVLLGLFGAMQKTRRKDFDCRLYRQRRTRQKNRQLPFLDCRFFRGGHHPWRLSR